MTKSDLQQVLRIITPAIKGALAQERAKTKALELRVAELEARPIGLKYCGTWQQGQTYGLHDGVTHQGSLWVAKTYTARGEPGVDPVCWQLCAKRGRDARDAR